MKKIIEPLQKIRSIPLSPGAEGADIDMWINAGVPGGSLTTDDNRYFKFHHSNGEYLKDIINMNCLCRYYVYQILVDKCGFDKPLLA
jgi:hypothetical protein